MVMIVGLPLEVDGPELKAYRVPREAQPLTAAANQHYGDHYRKITDVVMARLNELLDPEYQFAPQGAQTTEKGMRRFL